eukprot:m.482790 g.482790  ORF g.482790 m.482790 type:complete len:196 (+) comp22667_c0_seq1:317-904(+)
MAALLAVGAAGAVGKVAAVGAAAYGAKKAAGGAGREMKETFVMSEKTKKKIGKVQDKQAEIDARVQRDHEIRRAALDEKHAKIRAKHGMPGGSVSGDGTEGARGEVKSGYMQKRGRLNTGLKKRWFTLTRDGKLSYFKAPGEQPLGVVEVKGATTNVSDHGSHGELVVKTPGRTYTLQGLMGHCLQWQKAIDPLT